MIIHDIVSDIKKYIHSNPISWELVNSLGKLRISKASYFYIIIVPVLAKALSKIQNPVKVKFGADEILLVLDLPFSWYLFYFGAVAIALGTLIYQLRCPELIKKYKSYGEFLDAGESDSYLKEIAKKFKYLYSPDYLGKPYTPKTSTRKVKTIQRTYYNIPQIPAKEEIFFEEFEVNVKYQEERKNYFNELYKHVNYCFPVITYVSFILYIIGFTAFGWVIIQNLDFVITQLSNFK